MTTPASPMTTLSAVSNVLPTQPLAPAPVTASPIPPPQQQTVPQDNTPQAGGIIKGLYGKTLGRAMRGLGMVDTSYAVDPETGKTVPVQAKAQPGETARAILAAGLLGSHGIGPREGQLTFAQGLLSGLSGGMDASRELQMQKEAKARADAQQQFENELKTKQDKRADQDLQMRKTLDNAQIANLNVERLSRSWAFARTKELARRNDQLTTVQGLEAADKPYKDMFDELSVQPLAEATTPEEYQKLLQDDASDIHLHNAIPVITGHVLVTTKNPDGTTTVTPEPVGNIYRASDMKFTKSTLADLKANGVKETDPLYKEVENDVKNNASVNPSKVVAVYRHLDSLQNWAKNQSEIARNNAEATRARVGTRSEGVQAELASLKLGAFKEKQLGENLFSAIGDPDGINIGKKHISIPTTPTGAYDFTQLNPEEKSALRNYLWAAHQDASKQYVAAANAATKEGVDNPQNDPAAKDAYSTLSTLGSMYHDLTGMNISQNTSAATQAVENVKKLGLKDPVQIQHFMNTSNVPPEIQTQIWQGLGLEPPKEKTPEPLLSTRPSDVEARKKVSDAARKVSEIISNIPTY